ncbi:MAG: hypothetical protein NPIRA04_32100 [Nitrospirales bacterium]|nr:MAG: hypothetical protein NPIRA04_32100 [Nitrospirales bacterium]
MPILKSLPPKLLYGRVLWVSLMITLMFFSQLLLSLSYAFDSFEHRYIGNQAVKKLKATELAKEHSTALTVWETTISNMGNNKNLRKGGFNKLNFTFGDLAAMAGDHSETPEELKMLLIILRGEEVEDTGFWDFFNTHTQSGEEARIKAIRRQWNNACAWVIEKNTDWKDSQIDDTESCFERALKVQDEEIEKQLKRGSLFSNPVSWRDGYLPSRLELAEFEQLVGYVSLVRENDEHFPPSSHLTYERYHIKAIEFAQAYSESHSSQELMQSIIFEGFAQHFLHDSFASGHLAADYAKQFKEDLEHTHDEYNKKGILVFNNPNIFVWPLNKDQQQKRQSTLKKLKAGWIAFGDKHLFIPEASFHRYVVIQTAFKSLWEVFKATIKTKRKIEAQATDSSKCKMCTTQSFPEKSNNTFIDDIRISPLTNEGWKILAGAGILFSPYEDGKSNYKGSTFNLKSPFKNNKNKRHNQIVGAASIELGYVRSTEPWVPNYYGVGGLIAPGARTSIYPLSVGYWSRKSLFSGPTTMGLRLNAGLRTDEAETVFSLNAPKDRIAGELSLVFDFLYNYRSPISFFVRYEILSTTISGVFFEDLKVRNDSIFYNGSNLLMFGIGLDLAAVLK